MLKLFVEEEQNDRAFEALTRFLEAVDALPAGGSGRAALDPLALAFQLKLLWLSGYVPHLESCVECGGVDGLVGYLASAGGAVCSPCAPDETVFLSPEGFRAMHALIWSPLSDALGLDLGERALKARLRSSSPRTSSTVASACVRSPREARPRRRLRARRRSRTDRSRGGSRLSLALVLGEGDLARCRTR